MTTRNPHPAEYWEHRCRDAEQELDALQTHTSMIERRCAAMEARNIRLEHTTPPRPLIDTLALFLAGTIIGALWCAAGIYLIAPLLDGWLR